MKRKTENRALNRKLKKKVMSIFKISMLSKNIMKIEKIHEQNVFFFFQF